MTAPWPVVALAAVLGLAVGSFLNVVIHRVPRGESVVSPPSHCPRCDTQIKGRHNVPVLGWLVLRGRCASCALPISARYPLVEAVTGALFAAVAVRYGMSAELPAFLYLAAIAVVLVMIRADGHPLPDRIVLPSYVVALTLLLPAGAVGGDWHQLARAVAGAAVLTVFAVTLHLTLTTGLDTVRIAGLLGLYLGWASWSAVLVGAVALGGIAALGRATSTSDLTPPAA